MKPKELIKGMVYFDVVAGWFCIFTHSDRHVCFNFTITRSGSSRSPEGEYVYYNKRNLSDLIVGSELSKLLYGVKYA